MKPDDAVNVPVDRPPAWRRALPLVLGTLLVAWVITRLDLRVFASAIASTNLAGFFAFALAFNAALLAADSFATAHVYRTTVCPIGFRELFILRAASYLPSMLNHHVGQAWLTYFLARVYGAPLWRVAGATLLVYASILASLVVVGLLALPFNHVQMPWLAPTVGALVVAGVGYLTVIGLAPRRLARWQAAAPLFEAGVRGHLGAVLVRLPHIGVQFVGAWLPFWFFDVNVPLADALALVPPLMVVVALPITPQGVGTRDVFALGLFARYAQGSAAEQAASVAAATLSWAVAITLVQVTLSPLFMRRAYRLLGEREET